MLPKVTPIIRFVVLATAAWLAIEAPDCSAQGLEQMLIGNWEVDIAATKKLGKQSAEEFGELGDFDVSLRFDFSQDGVLAMSVRGSENDSSDLGKWSVTKEDPQLKKLTIDVQSAVANSKDTMILEFVDSKRIKATTVEKESKRDAPFILRRVTQTSEKK